jgi:hypothetical protein
MVLRRDPVLPRAPRASGCVSDFHFRRMRSLRIQLAGDHRPENDLGLPLVA